MEYGLTCWSSPATWVWSGQGFRMIPFAIDKKSNKLGKKEKHNGFWTVGNRSGFSVSRLWFCYRSRFSRYGSCRGLEEVFCSEQTGALYTNRFCRCTAYADNLRVYSDEYPVPGRGK